mgnify:CR=1 FL=1
MSKKSDIGILGLGVMGQNLALNFEHNGYAVSVYNRIAEGEEKIVDDFIENRCDHKQIYGYTNLKIFIQSLKRPRKIFLMIKAGPIVDNVLESIIPLLAEDDIVIDGGNSYYLDTNRRIKLLNKHKIEYLGCGVSGGSYGALNGPSIMPGGSYIAWNATKKMLRKIAAKDKNNNPCCQIIGLDGSGHYVKMVHNGIEYAIMQILAESYDVQKNICNMDNNEIYTVMEKWANNGLRS